MLWACISAIAERACFTAELMADLRHFQEWLRESFGHCTREEMPFRYLVWGSRAPTAWNMGGNLASFTKLIRDQDEADAARLRLPLHRHPLRQLSRPRPADPDRGAGPGRCHRRRLRGHADQRRGHRRARPPSSGCPRSCSTCSPAWARTACCAGASASGMARILIEDGADPQRRRDARAGPGRPRLRARRGRGRAAPVRRRARAAGSPPIWRSSGCASAPTR